MRSKRRPLGRPDSQAVRDGNVLAARAFLLCLLASCKGIWWVLEQPTTSLMHEHPMFKHLAKLVGIRRIRINMSSYGGPTKKATHLYSSLSAECNVFETIEHVFMS